MAEVSNKAALPLEGHCSPAPGTPGEGVKTKGSRDWHQNLVLDGNQNPNNVFLSSSLKSLLSFCPPPPLALESLSYNRKIVSLLLFSAAQHWAPFPEQVFKQILKRDCFPMRQWGGRCALWQAVACLLALGCSKSKLGVSTETNGVSLMRLLALGDAVFFLFFSEERNSHIQHLSLTEAMIETGDPAWKNIWSQECFERLG